ncbi:MAG TPA: TRAP transporter small permease [Hydrogenophaga sp.]|uniref:TRAP transporter small permease n=1 Tax=Hydrogenophaga sp. TaxID=1904254 RepID=UPI002BBFA9E7|nr:TRAP transporter small permease [Hydrogenophaga sp.]HSX94316.1 TRAP transporter small permease [Hydrogenophaga sp.]
MALAREGRVERALKAVGTLSLLALMLIVTIDVAGRNLFNSPLLWGTEVMEVLLGLMVFVFYPVLARRHGHIVVDLVPVPRAMRGLQRLLAGGVGAALFGVIAWTCARQALRSAGYGDASAILGIPTAWVLWGMAALAGLSALIFVAQAMGAWRRETVLAEEER